MFSGWRAIVVETFGAGSHELRRGQTVKTADWERGDREHGALDGELAIERGQRLLERADGGDDVTVTLLLQGETPAKH